MRWVVASSSQWMTMLETGVSGSPWYALLVLASYSGWRAGGLPARGMDSVAVYQILTLFRTDRGTLPAPGAKYGHVTLNAATEVVRERE